MKYLVIILFAFTTYAQDGATRFFVDRDASGSADGTSWADAWLNPEDIDFSALTAGDTVYVSGGADSTTYYPSSASGIVLGNVSSGSGVYTFASGNPVVICPSWETNHNGDVYLSALNAHGRVLGVGNISNVKITGFTLLDQRTQNLNGGSMVQLGNADWDQANGGTIDSLITLDDCHIISKGFASLITLSGCKSTFSNNYQETIANEYGYEQDQFGINGGRGGHTIINNIMIARNHLTDTIFSANASVTIDATTLTDTRLSYSTNQFLGASVKVGLAYLQIVTHTSDTFTGTGWVNYDEDGNASPAATPASGSEWELVSDAHRDGIQISNIGYVFGADSLWRLNNERLDFTIANNLYVDYYTGGSHQNNMLYNYGWIVTTDVRFLIYNNIFVNRKTESGIGGIAIGRYYIDSAVVADEEYPDYNSIYLLNNTIISKGTSGSMVTGWSADTLVMKNNLFVKDGDDAPNLVNWGNFGWEMSALYKDIDYNYYFEPDTITSPFAVMGGTNYSWSTFQGLQNSDASYYESNGLYLLNTRIAFTEKYGLEKIDYYTTTGRDSAIDLSATYPFLSTDALGNARSGTWDVGALEYQAVVDGNNYYVNKDVVGGTSDGSSWANAEASLSALNWSLIGVTENDTVFISGGSDSTTYTAQTIDQWTESTGDNITRRNYLVVIAEGKDAGHNGDVYFVNTDTTKNGALQISFTTNIKVTGMDFIANTPINLVGDISTVLFSAVDSITIDNCYIYTNAYANGLTSNFSTETKVTNNYIEVVANNYTTDQDCLQMYSGGGGHTITGNTMIGRGTVNTGFHHDIIQMGTGEGGTNNYQTTIANNLLLYDAITGGSNVIYLSELGSNRFLIYNNIIASTCDYMDALVFNINEASSDLSLRLFNNTIITDSGFGVTVDDIDTLVMKNNIVLNGDGSQASLWLSATNGIDDIASKDIDYNRYYKNATPIIYNESATAWGTWQGLGYDANSDTSTVTFAGEVGTTINNYFTTAGRNAGTDLSSYFTTDYLSNTRSGTWDIGALEYQGTVGTPTRVRMRQIIIQ